MIIKVPFHNLSFISDLKGHVVFNIDNAQITQELNYKDVAIETKEKSQLIYMVFHIFSTSMMINFIVEATTKIN